MLTISFCGHDKSYYPQILLRDYGYIAKGKAVKIYINKYLFSSHADSSCNDESIFLVLYFLFCYFQIFFESFFLTFYILIAFLPCRLKLVFSLIDIYDGFFLIVFHS